MSDRRIDQLETKPNLVGSDLIVVSENSGTTWKSTLTKFRDYLFALVDLIPGPPDRNDSVFFRQFSDGQVKRVTLEKLLPNQVVTNAMIQDGSDTAGTGITANKLAPGSVIESKIADNAVVTSHIQNAEISNIDNYPPKIFRTGITTAKICDAAVTGIKGGVPPGSVFHFAARTAPEGYLICNGDTITTNLSGSVQGVPNWRLQDLRIVLGTTFGADGQLPDLRGVFVRGYGGGQTSSGGSHNSFSGGIGRNTKAVAKHFLRAGAGQRTGAQIRTEAEGAESDTNAYSYFVIEYMNVGATVDNPGDGIYNPRSDTPVNVVAWAKGTTPTLNPALTTFARYKIYSMRWLSSGEFGKTQEMRYSSHTHAVSEKSHTHDVEVLLDPAAFEHTHPDVSIGFNNDGVGKDSWIIGGREALVPGCGSNKCTGAVGSSDGKWVRPVENNPANGVLPGIRRCASTTVSNDFTIATCESSVSYGYGATAGAPVYSRPTNVSTIAGDPVDETRPANVALLPCIKY